MFKSKQEFKLAFGSARKSLREAARMGETSHSIVWSNLNKCIKRIITSEEMPVSVKVCLYLCRKQGRKTNDFVSGR